MQMQFFLLAITFSASDLKGENKKLTCEPVTLGSTHGYQQIASLHYQHCQHHCFPFVAQTHPYIARVHIWL
jgi:hypothetical protein